MIYYTYIQPNIGPVDWGEDLVGQQLEWFVLKNYLTMRLNEPNNPSCIDGHAVCNHNTEIIHNSFTLIVDPNSPDAKAWWDAVAIEDQAILDAQT